MYVVNGLGNEVGLDFCDLSADGAYLVAVAGVIVAGFIDGGSLESVSYDEPQLQEEIDSVVEGGATDGEVVVAYQLVAQVVKREMSVNVINSLQDGISLWGLAMIVHLKIAVENAQHILPNVYFYHICASLNL